MTNHMRATLREANADHITFHAGSNNLKAEKTAGQTAKATIDLVTSLKSN